MEAGERTGALAGTAQGLRAAVEAALAADRRAGEERRSLRHTVEAALAAASEAATTAQELRAEAEDARRSTDVLSDRLLEVGRAARPLADTARRLGNAP